MIEIYSKVSVNKARSAWCSIRAYKGLKANGPFAFSFFLRCLKSLLNALTVRITLKLSNLQCLLFAIRTLISHYGWEQGKSTSKIVLTFPLSTGVVVWFSFRLVTTSAAKLLPAAISKLLQYVISWRANPNGTYSISRFPGHWVNTLWRCRFPRPLHVLLSKVMEQTSPKFANLYDSTVQFSYSLPSNS